MLFLDKENDSKKINLLPAIEDIHKLPAPEVDFESIDELVSFVAAKVGKDKKYVAIVIKYIFEEMMYMMLEGWIFSFWPVFKLRYSVKPNYIKYKSYTRWRFIREWYKKILSLEKDDDL